MLRKILAAAFAAFLVVGAAGTSFAQATEQVREEVSVYFEQHGIDADVEALSDDQVLELMTIIDSDATDVEKESQIQLVLGG